MSDEKEVWKQYPEYSFVEVSNLGRVRTKDRIVTYKDGRKRLVVGRVLRQFQDNKGYMRVGFSVNCKVIHRKVHRMVADCFIPNHNNLPQVNHKDCDKTNNNVSNLEWCSNEYNSRYREKYGKSLGRPLFAIDLITFKILKFRSQHEAQRQLNISRRSIDRVIKGLRSSIHGFWFCNIDENAVEKTREKFSDEVAKKVEKLIGESCN